MNTLSICLVGLVGFTLIFLIRSAYTLNIFNKTDDLIHDYCVKLIDDRKYNRIFNYYAEMKISYGAYLFNPLVFGRYNAIKSEYRQLVKDFDKTR